MIRLTALQKQFGQTHVLRGIDAQIEQGDFITIVGASGAGKSTLLHLLAGLDQPSSGSIAFNGEPLETLGAKERNRWRNEQVGLVFQFHNLLPELSAEENVILPRLIGQKDRNAALEDARSLLDKLGLADRASHLPSALSGGEQQRVAIARALINSPALLLADEPTGNLDSANAQAIHERLVALNKSGQTLVVVTHNDSLAALGTKQWQMKDGKLFSVLPNTAGDGEAGTGAVIL